MARQVRPRKRRRVQGQDQVARLHLRSCLARLGVDPAELSEITENREVLRVFLELFLPLLPPNRV